MSEPARGVWKRLAPHLEGLSAIDAAERMARPGAALAGAMSSFDCDPARLVIDAYEARILGRTQRRAAGVYYTPPHVVEGMLDRVPLGGVLLDPAAGAGAFVVAMARRLGPEALSKIHACDVDGGALDAAALALEVALGRGERARIERWRRQNAHHADFLRAPPELPPPSLIVGNPPYGVTGEGDLRGLFPELRGEVDLYACFVLRALGAVAEGGTTALLVPDTWLTNRRAASFRRALVERTGISQVVDFGKPFAAARDTRVHALVLRRGAQAARVESTRDGRLEPMADVSAAALEAGAEAGWFLYRTGAEEQACREMWRKARPLSETFDVIYGLRTGNNAQHAGVGGGLVPLVGGGDLGAYDRAAPGRHLREPAAFSRALGRQQGRWKVGVQRIRTNSALSWRRWVEAAPLSPAEVGLDSLTLLAERGAADCAGPSPALCALLGVLNSSVLNRWYRLSFTDVNVKPAYLGEIPLPPLDEELAHLVATRLSRPGDLALERAIDRQVAQAYGLSAEALEVLESGFWGEERKRRPMPSAEAMRLISGV